MKNICLCILLIIVWKETFSQISPTAPMSGSKPEGFASGKELFGSVENTVNLFTGDAQFPINLASLPGRGGLDVNVSMNYSSNVRLQATTWNAESPTGIVGLGWALDYPKIVVDNKSSGAKDDDTYYLSMAGAMNELRYTGQSSGVKQYQSKSYLFWSIKYTVSGEKWEIIDENGTKYTYGDSGSGRFSVQYIVHWNNWIGNGASTSSQKQQVFIWNLSQVTNLWGESVVYTYSNVEQNVGVAAGKLQTEASYLSRIDGLDGRYIEFAYSLKNSSEYYEPHTENGENSIDAYQERYETKYLDYLNVMDAAAGLLYKADLSYSTIGSGTLTKRILTEVRNYNPQNNSLPGYKFEYLNFNEANTNYGALKSVTMPTGGKIIFKYGQQTNAKSKRDYHIQSISGYAMPKVWIGPDYVVVTRRATDSGGPLSTGAKDVKLQVFQWDGEWKEWDRTESLLAVKMVDQDGNTSSSLTDNSYDYQNFYVTIQKDFFAVMNRPDGSANYTINIFRKDITTRNGWTKKNYTYSSSLLSTDGYRESLISGERFVVFCGNKGNLHTVTWNGTDWAVTSTSRAAATYSGLAAGGNYFISQAFSGGDGVKFYFLQEDGTWLAKAASTFDASSSARSYWYAGPAYAIVMAQNNPEYAYHWDESYTVTRKSLGLTLDDNSYVDFANAGLIGFVHPSGTYNYAIRYDGSSWHSSANMDYYGSNPQARNMFSYGDDFIVRPKDATTVGLKKFNANSNTWTDAIYPTTNSQLLFAGYNYFIPVDPADATKANLYYKNTSGAFVKDPTSFSGLRLTPSTQGAPQFQEARFGWQGGTDFVLKSINAQQSYLCGLQGILFRNGLIDPSKIDFTTLGDFNSLCPVMNDLGYVDPVRTMVSGNTLAIYLAEPSQQDATSLRLFKQIDGEATGGLIDFPVRSVITNSGDTESITALSYDPATATTDATGEVTQYHKVTVKGGNGVQGVDGTTEYYFLNGLASNEVLQPFPSDGSSSSYNSKLFSSLPYKTLVKNASYVTVGETTMSWQLFTQATQSITSTQWNYIRQFSVKQVQDQVSNVTVFDYNLLNGMAKSKTSYTLNGTSQLNPQTDEFMYWFEAYDQNRTRNILTGVVQSKSKLNGVVLKASATRYQAWGGSNVPAPYQTYSWKNYSASDFTAWSNTATVPDQWRLQSTVVAIDATRGLVTQVKGADDSNSSFIFSGKGQLLAEIQNAAVADVFYEGFESATSNTSSDAKAGAKSSTTSMTVSPPPGGNGWLTYWFKPTGGSWQLAEQGITGTTSIGGSGALIDEVRVIPKTAMMTSFSYDSFGNVISTNDVNNIVLKREYDEFQRPKASYDANGNVTTTYNYTVSQQ